MESLVRMKHSPFTKGNTVRLGIRTPKTLENKESPTALSKTLRDWRTARKSSGRLIAERMFVSKSLYYDWETGKSVSMSLDEMLAFCKVLQIDPKDFITTYICNRDE